MLASTERIIGDAHRSQGYLSYLINNFITRGRLNSGFIINCSIFFKRTSIDIEGALFIYLFTLFYTCVKH